MRRIADLPPGSWIGVAVSHGFRVTRNECLWWIVGDDAFEALASDDPWTYLDELAQESADLSDDYADLTLEGVYCQLPDLPDGFVCNPVYFCVMQRAGFVRRKHSRVGTRGRWMPPSHVFCTGRTYCRSWFALLVRT